MKKDEPNVDLIQYIYIAVLALVLILIFTFLTKINIKHSKPIALKTLDQRLEKLPSSALRLSDEAKVIFAEQIENPEWIHFSWFKSGAIRFAIHIPESQLNRHDLYLRYIPKYEENHWIRKDNAYFIQFKHQLTGDQSCISTQYKDEQNYWIIEFIPSKEDCGLFSLL